MRAGTDPLIDMKTIEIIIPGEPIGKGRARSARLPNGRTTHYTPQKTRTWEGIARSFAIDAFGEDREPLDCPVALDILIVYSIAKSWPEWKRRAALIGEIEPTVKPDADNVEKAVKDALNGVVWRDDCQVVNTTKRTVYGPQPGVRVFVQPRETLPAQIKTRPRGLGI